MVLLLLTAVAAFTASALDEAVTNRALAGARLAQQRAFNAASAGLNLAIAELRKGSHSPLHTYELPGADAEVRVEEKSRVMMPAGYSAGRFVEQFYEIRSSGSSVRGARSVQVQGLKRVEAEDPAPAYLDSAP